MLRSTAALIAVAAWAGIAQAQPNGPSLCGQGEKVLFACRYGEKLASVCARGEVTVYRFGHRNRVDLEIESNGHDGSAFKSMVTGQGSGGYQSSIRFKRGGYNYIVSSGDSGALSDRPGTPLDVISIMKGHNDVGRHDCKRTVKERLFDAHVPDDPDPAFEAWY